MDYNLNRFFVGVSILFILFTAFFYNLDFFLYCFITTLIFYELHRTLFKSINKIIFLSLLFIFELLVSYFLINNFIFFIVITIFFLLSSIYSEKNFILYFSLFVINILILIFKLSVFDRNIIYLIISISFINDTIAYIIGSNIKGPLISPKLSPKKTWSGTSVSFCITTFLFIYFDYNLFIAPFMAISLFFGDIYFSFIKRKLGIKDFSRMLSTHGGILDRFDSITFLIIIFATLNH